MTRLRSHALPAAIVVVVACLAVLVLRGDPPATWLSVRAPARVQIDRPYIATVTLLEPMDGTFLDFDLHGLNARNHSLRCVAAGTSLPVSSGKHEYSFSLLLRDRPDLDRVNAIIYLSRTGRWSDQFRVARSSPILVVRDGSGETAAASPAIGLDVHGQVDDPAIDVPNPPAVRGLGFLIWGIGAFGAAIAWRRLQSPRGWPMLALLLAAIALVEATAAAAMVSDLARSLARAADVYELRREFQQFATVVGLCAMGVVVAAGLRRPRRLAAGPALAGIGLYAVITLAGMLSLHEVDRILALGIGPWPLAAVLRLLAAGTATAGVAHRMIRRR